VIKSKYHEIQDEYREREIEELRIQRIKQDQMIADMESRIEQMGLNNYTEGNDAMVE
jgi:hypothetical protein